MKSAIAASLLVAVPAAATECAAGYKHKADLSSLFCANAKTDADACTNCCEADKTTCGGVGLKCEFGSYADSGDAWKNTKTTANKEKDATKKQAKFQTECCKPSSTCGSTLYTCPAGYKKKDNGVSSTNCPGDAASCSNDKCCTEDSNTCGGAWFANSPGGMQKVVPPGGLCAAGSFPKDGTDPVFKDDKWLATTRIGTGSTGFQKQCCNAMPTCSSSGYECPAGYTKDDKQKAKVCDVGANGYAIENCAKIGGTTQCCKKDKLTCGGSAAATTCTAAMYAPTTDNWKAKKFQTGKQNLECCTEKATCAVAKCPSGWKKRANVDVLSCPSNRDSCATAAARCCEVDALTCGGLKNTLNCPYGTYSEASYFTKDTPQATIDAWNVRATTQATRNTDCCTAQAVCSADGYTTTPAATVTPAAPLRLYKAHKVAAAEDAKGSSALWLGAGVVMGMAVIMGVQSVRSRQVNTVAFE